MAKRQGISKWQEKSSRINQIRWELEAVLNEGFSPEEKQSDKYKELVESVKTVFKYAMPCSYRRAWLMTLLISITTSAGVIIVKLIDFLIEIVRRGN